MRVKCLVQGHKTRTAFEYTSCLPPDLKSNVLSAGTDEPTLYFIVLVLALPRSFTNLLREFRINEQFVLNNKTVHVITRFNFISGSSSYRSEQTGSQASPPNESSTVAHNPYFPKVGF